jgi:hypothetical protein
MLHPIFIFSQVTSTCKKSTSSIPRSSWNEEIDLLRMSDKVSELIRMLVDRLWRKLRLINRGGTLYANLQS